MPKLTENYLTVPNLPFYIREMNEQSPIKVVLNLFNQLSFRNKLVFMKNNLSNIKQIANKDFIRGLLIFAELEILMSKNKKIKSVVLSHYALDLVAAFHQDKIITEFKKLADSHHLKAGIETYNAKLVGELVKKSGLSKSVYILDKG